MNPPNTPSTSAYHSVSQAPNASFHQPLGNPPDPMIHLQMTLDQSIERILEKRLDELVTTITTRFKKTLKTTTEEVNRLKKVIESLEFAQEEAPTRSVTAILPRIIIKLGADDIDTMSKLGPEGILNRLGSLEDLYSQITSARVDNRMQELHLYTQSRSIHKQLMKDTQITELMRGLGLSDDAAPRREMHWVILHEYALSDEYLKCCADHLDSIRRDTGLKINEVKYMHKRFMWGFEDSDEAMKACQQPLFFSGDHALARPFDQRGTPACCRRCGRPDHMQDSDDCPNKNLFAEGESWPCLICAQKHPVAGATLPCPNKDNKALHRCLNCIEADLDDANHRTDFYRCPAPIAVLQRAKRRNFANQPPEWAATIQLPSTDELRARVAKGNFPKRPLRNKGNAKADSSGQAEESGAGSGTHILNRKGLMQPKKKSTSSAQGEAVESDADVMEFESAQATTVETSNPSLPKPTTVNQLSRKARDSSEQLGILNYLEPTPGGRKIKLNIPPSSSTSTDATSPAHDDNATPKRGRGRPKGSLEKEGTYGIRHEPTIVSFKAQS